MTIKFVFSSVPMTAVVSPDARSIPIGPLEHNHHYQVTLDEDALKDLAGSDPLRLMFTQAAYKAIRDGDHENAALYASVFGVKIGSPHYTTFDDVSNHNAVQGVVNEAMHMASELVL